MASKGTPVGFDSETVHELTVAPERASAHDVMAGLHAIATRRPTEDPTSQFDDILDTAVAITGARACTLQLREHPEDELSLVAERAWEPALDPAAESASTRTTLLVARSGAVLGVLSARFAPSTPPTVAGAAALDVLARLCADMVEQQQLLREVREAEGKHRQFLEAIADPVVIVDEAGNIAFANGQAERVFGYAPGELIGQAHDVLLPESARAVHQEHTARYHQQPTARVMASAPGRPLAARRKDGTEFPIEVALNPFQTSRGVMVSTVLRDVSERRRLEAAAELHADRLGSAIEAIPDVIAIWDPDDRLVACNEAFRSLFPASTAADWVGLSAAEVVARPTPFLGPKDAEAWFGADARVQSAVFEVALRDGRRFRVTSRRKGVGGRVTTGIDLTEDLVREKELELARERAEAANHAKDEFLASMSHELRTPLNAVLGFCQLLQRDRKDHLTDRQREMVDQVAKGGEHLLALIDDVLDLARIEANRVSIAAEPVSVQETVSEVVQTFGPLAERAGVALCLDPVGEAAAAVDADPRRFVQILMNLTSNAIKYNVRGGTVTFVVSRPSPELVRVTVVDTGRGIAVDQQPKLFTAFHRAGQEGGNIQGTGIGLVISRRLAELMGGRVGFTSTLGIGSSFWVDLPAVVADVPRARGASPAATISAPYRGLVVYVDDNPASLTFMRMVLEQLDGLELLTAATAQEGLALVRERRPGLVLMDINLPDMSGFDALALLKASPETRDIPVVAVSAAASADTRARGLLAGFHRYVTKPVRVDELEGVIRECLTRSA